MAKTRSPTTKKLMFQIIKVRPILSGKTSNYVETRAILRGTTPSGIKLYLQQQRAL